ncbi:competence type IV pilus ATPase ComGA [Bacillus salitolerans]|uniref:Competence type IV pilus ATPase ComGA n=1 Tax=Bacillus salitolerans TaxID=1437434 RepID=A0ABW4LMY5_9BACI
MSMVEHHAEGLIHDAVKKGVTDIHLIPKKTECHIKYRIGSHLFTKTTIPKDLAVKLLSHFKFLASMDIGEKRRPQSGSLMISVNQVIINLRLSTLPTHHDESLVIRLLPQDESYPLSELSLFPNSTKTLLSFMTQIHGLIIFTGPTGSGKTTTLYSLLHASIERTHRNVITLEDPIEKFTENLLQVQVNEKAGITYSTGLKAILRHDPDIIMVGEIRDEETAKIAIRAALTGHLVLSTMHTKDTKGAIYRLLEFNVSLQEIEQTVIAVAAQRLFEVKCPFCNEQCSALCRKWKGNRRVSVYEILFGTSLKGVIDEAKGKDVTYSYPTLFQLVNKGIALGYLSRKDLEGWELEKTTTS